MSGSKQAISSVLGTTTAAAIVLPATGTVPVWLMVTTGATVFVGVVTLAMSLYANRYR